MDTLMGALVDAVAIGGLTWATIMFNKLAFRTARKILLYDGDTGYLEWKVKRLQKQLDGPTWGEDSESEERTGDES